MGMPERQWPAHMVQEKNIPAGGSKWPSSAAAASEEARRYGPHFVGPFARAIDLGERKSPFNVSDLRSTLVEPLSDARTKLADVFSILIKVNV
jgi:hypothetical protein